VIFSCNESVCVHIVIKLYHVWLFNETKQNEKKTNDSYLSMAYKGTDSNENHELNGNNLWFRICMS